MEVYLPDVLGREDAIDECKELAKGVFGAHSLTLFVVACEQGAVVCPQKVHIWVDARQARLLWTGKTVSKKCECNLE